MAIALVAGQDVSAYVAASGTTLAVSFPSGTAAGNLVTVLNGCGGAGGPTAPTDDKGQTYTLGMSTGTDSGGVLKATGYYLKNSVAGAITVTNHWSATITSRCIAIAEWSGVRQSSPFDIQGGGDDLSGFPTLNSGSAATNFDGELIWGCGLASGGSGVVGAAGSGFTLLSDSSGGIFGSEYEIQPSGGALSITFAGSPSTWFCGGMTFKPSPVTHIGGITAIQGAVTSLTTAAIVAAINAGDLIVVSWRDAGGGSTVTVTDNQGQTYIVGSGQGTGNGDHYLLNSKAIPANTLTITVASTISGTIRIGVDIFRSRDARGFTHDQSATESATIATTCTAIGSNTISPASGDLVFWQGGMGVNSEGFTACTSGGDPGVLGQTIGDATLGALYTQYVLTSSGTAGQTPQVAVSVSGVATGTVETFRALVGASPLLLRLSLRGPRARAFRLQALLSRVSGVALNQYVFAADPGTYTLSGVAAQVRAQRLVPATAGAYTVTGAAAQLTAQRLVKANAGVYVLSGAAAVLTAQRLLNASPGAYVLSGKAAQLVAGRLLAAAAGSYTLSGAAARVLAARLLSAVPGVYVLNGADAALIGPHAAFTLAADPGTYSLTGAAILATAAHQLFADIGQYVLSGAAAQLTGPAAPAVARDVGAGGTARRRRRPGPIDVPRQVLERDTVWSSTPIYLAEPQPPSQREQEQLVSAPLTRKPLSSTPQLGPAKPPTPAAREWVIMLTGEPPDIDEPWPSVVHAGMVTAPKPVFHVDVNAWRQHFADREDEDDIEAATAALAVLNVV